MIYQPRRPLTAAGANSFQQGAQSQNQQGLAAAKTGGLVQSNQSKASAPGQGYRQIGTATLPPGRIPGSPPPAQPKLNQTPVRQGGTGEGYQSAGQGGWTTTSTGAQAGAPKSAYGLTPDAFKGGALGGRPPLPADLAARAGDNGARRIAAQAGAGSQPIQGRFNGMYNQFQQDATNAGRIVLGNKGGSANISSIFPQNVTGSAGPGGPPPLPTKRYESQGVDTSGQGLTGEQEDPPSVFELATGGPGGAEKIAAQQQAADEAWSAAQGFGMRKVPPDEGDTVTVNGRVLKRRGNAWVDEGAGEDHDTKLQNVAGRLKVDKEFIQWIYDTGKRIDGDGNIYQRNASGEYVSWGNITDPQTEASAWYNDQLNKYKIDKEEKAAAAAAEGGDGGSTPVDPWAEYSNSGPRQDVMSQDIVDKQVQADAGRRAYEQSRVIQAAMERAARSGASPDASSALTANLAQGGALAAADSEAGIRFEAEKENLKGRLADIDREWQRAMWVAQNARDDQVAAQALAAARMLEREREEAAKRMAQFTRANERPTTADYGIAALGGAGSLVDAGTSIATAGR